LAQSLFSDLKQVQIWGKLILPTATAIITIKL
jgi:hypothetical protein